MTEAVAGAVASEPAATPAPVAQPDPGTAPETQQQDPKPDRTFTQRELDEILEKRLAKERRKRAEIETRLKVTEELALRAKPAEPKPEPKAADGEPKRENFSTYEDYLEARADWRAERKTAEALEARFREQEKRNTDTQQAARLQKMQETWQASVAKAAERYADFDDVLEASDAPMTQAMHAAIMDADDPAAVAYHLAKNKQEAERIAGLDPRLQAREIWKLETGIPKAQAKPSKAPPPIDPVRGKSTVTDDDEPDPKDTEKWVKWRNRQLAKRRG